MASDYEAIREENIRKYGQETAHLELLADLYPDRTHFIFELIQNAEDAGATTLSFRLDPDRLEVFHNGRPFTAEDVIGICGVVAGTKREDLTQIGRFGIGFKSVYAYTRAPEVHCRDEHFVIRDYVRPYRIDGPAGLGQDETRFVFPFDRPDRPADLAAQEIAGALQQLELRTLLFLRHVQRIEVVGVRLGTFMQERKTEGRRVTLFEAGADKQRSETWSVWSRGLDESQPRLRVECAFLHSRDSDVAALEAVDRSPLVVFFPTAKETHLGFLIQGPYRTTPGRDNVPENDEWNRHLVDETARLLCEVLVELRDSGQLNATVLSTMPIVSRDFGIGTMFRPLFEAMCLALQDLELLPKGSGYARSSDSKLARGGDLRELLDPEQLGVLCDSNGPLYWVISGITQDRFPALWSYLRDDLHVEVLEPEGAVTRMTASFFENQTDDWTMRFYRYLEGQPALWRERGVARRRPIIRLEDDSHIQPFDAEGRVAVYLPSPFPTPGMKTVKRSIAQDPSVRPFLERLGISEPDLVTVVTERILPWYSGGGEGLGRDRLRDARVIADVLDKAGGSRRTEFVEALRRTAFLEAANAATGERRMSTAGTLYWRNPELEMYFERNPHAWFLAEEYEPWHRQLTELGVRNSIDVTVRKADSGGYVVLEDWHGQHERGLDRFDPAADVDGLDFAVQNPTPERSMFVWNKLLVPNVHLIVGLVEKSTRQEFIGSTREEVTSRLGTIVMSSVWIYDRSGSLRAPSAELSLHDLADGYWLDDSLARALGMATPAVEEASRELRIPATVLRALGRDPSLVTDVIALIEERLAAKDDEEEAVSQEESSIEHLSFAEEVARTFARPSRYSVSAEVDAQFEVIGAFGSVGNPELRRERVRESLEHGRLTEPAPEIRFQRVPRKVWESKNAAARNFLMEQYQGRCQICQDGFEKIDGSPYFEGLYLVSSTRARWIDRAGCMICLCPTCCAKFLHGPVVAEDILGQIDRWRSLREGGQSEPTLTIEMCGTEVQVRYTEKHFFDLQEMIKDS